MYQDEKQQRHDGNFQRFSQQPRTALLTLLILIAVLAALTHHTSTSHPHSPDTCDRRLRQEEYATISPVLTSAPCHMSCHASSRVPDRLGVASAVLQWERITNLLG